MHQPYYKDLATGEYKLPWTRLHALKDYYGMVRMLEEFPPVRQTFNLVPSMMAQVAEYAAGEAADPFLALALKPAASLTPEEQVSLLRNFFHANPQRMIQRYPRYGELYAAREAHADPEQARRLFGEREFRDLQMLSQMAWFDEEFQERDPEVREWIARGRDFTLADQERMGVKQREMVAAVLPAYQKLAAAGQIEISTTPYYHPILPLLCDSDIGGVSHPGLPLPPRFRYPRDARLQLQMARDYVAHEFGAAPAGLWPSEGSVSDEALALAADTGFTWAATDSGVLGRTLGCNPDIEAIYRPYRWERDGRAIHMIFRDHLLSDLIGFVYANVDAREAAGDFLRRIRDNAAPVLAAGRDALVPIILDGENAWEYFDHNGRPFLRELYARIAADPQMEAVTAAEAFRRMPAEPLGHIFPGSWIGANFDVWIGAEEDNRAWTLLLRARETFEAARGVPAADLRLAREELLIAEGSDWCWWYGPEHQSAQRPDFDQLFRSHLANVYRFLKLPPPEELSRPILRVESGAVHVPPSGPIRPTIDGEETSYFEWLGAGLYRVDERSGAMHGRQFLVREVQYGSDGENLFVRVDFRPHEEAELADLEMRLNLEEGEPGRARALAVRFENGQAHAADAGVECRYRRILELRIPCRPEARFQFSLWRDGLPIDAVPQEGWLESRIQ
jgi:alpha-amylase/alpha-mannosidase (GH57 family)